MPMNQRRTIGGFTLVELIIAMLVIAILASIAYPTYLGYTTRSNRTDATRPMMQLSEALQRCYSQAFTFVGCATAPVGATNSPNGYYTITVATPSATTFLITATPLAGTALNDTQCTNFTLTSASVQGATGTAGATKCWGGN